MTRSGTTPSPPDRERKRAGASIFVLVHGAWHGGWAWEKLSPLLEAAGHGVVAPDLPGHGDDRTPPGEVTLESYAERVVGVLDSMEGPAVLVGHSMGGIAISEAVERRPEKVGTLVYLCAYLLPDGVPMSHVARQDTGSVVTQSLRIDEKRGVAALPASAARRAWYGDCSEEDAVRAVARLGDEPVAPWGEPVAPWGEPVSVSEGNFGRVPRVYVTCLHNRSTTPSVQREMYTAVPCREVISMETDHSPFLSRPEELARHLTSLATP